MRLCRPELQESNSSMFENRSQYEQGEIGRQHFLERQLHLQEQALQVKEQLKGEHRFRLLMPLMNLARMYQLLWQVAVDSDQLELANDAQKKMTERFERAKEICHRHFGEEQADLLRHGLGSHATRSSEATPTRSDPVIGMMQAAVSAQCEQLVNVGFTDTGTNTQALLMAKGDINQAISFLIGGSVDAA